MKIQLLLAKATLYKTVVYHTLRQINDDICNYSLKKICIRRDGSSICEHASSTNMIIGILRQPHQWLTAWAHGE
jgi:hypothetical protein